MPPISPHAIATLLLTLAVFVAFATARLRIELVCLTLIAVLALGFYLFPLGQNSHYTDMEIAFGGFGHEALVAICCLMVLGRGLMVTGALDPTARSLAKIWQWNRTLGMLCTLVVCLTLSLFVNDTPVLVLALPILMGLAARVGVSASQTLMPVNFAILIGGMGTTIGTSTNLLVVSIAKDLGVPAFGVFSFTEIALTAALIALPYLWLVMPRLLPARPQDQQAPQRRYRAILHAEAGEAPLAPTLGDAIRRLGPAVSIVALERDKRAIPTSDTSQSLQTGDNLVIEGSLAQLQDASAALRAPLAPHTVLDSVSSSATSEREDEHIAELVIGVDSSLVGKNVRQAELADRYGTAVIGLARATPLPMRARATPHGEDLEVGDVLLVRGSPRRLADLERGEGALLLQGGVELPRSSKAPLALAIVAAVILLAATKLMPISLAALAGTIAMLATGTVRFERIGRALSVEVIVLVAASIGLGRAIVETGAATWLGSASALALAHVPPAAALAALMTFAAVLTNFVSNAAAAAIGTPLAVSLATALGIAPQPFVLAVLFGCNICYVTPMAYQTNLLIMSAGGYQFRDFVRAGLPLAILMVVTLSILLVRRYGL